MEPNRQVYLLDPKELNPETIAVTFAKTSRSPQSFREIASELTDERSAQFHEKWVVGYGHASVAEHAVLHIALENVSRLAVESIESNRLASYTEKSTRYQKWGEGAFFIPPELEAHPLKQAYLDLCRSLFAAYQRSLPAVRAVLLREDPPQPGESEAAWERRVRSQYVDVCRFLLPAASLANVGLTANARTLEHAIQKMLSHPLAEVREIGAEVKQVAQHEVPTLVKYADRVPYLEASALALKQAAAQVAQSRNEDWCRLVAYDPQGEERILAAGLYRFGQMGYLDALAYVQQLDPAGRRDLAERMFQEFGRFDIPLRELEHTSYTFDVEIDQGAYFEVKRHRMMTQTPQALTARLGYAVPRRIEAAGFGQEYCQAMEAACMVYEQLVQVNPALAAYVVPNGFHRRVLLTVNLRSAYHFCSLRSASNAHFSVRRLALRMAEQIRGGSPGTGSLSAAARRGNLAGS